MKLDIKTEKTFTLELTQTELNALTRGLSGLRGSHFKGSNQSGQFNIICDIYQKIHPQSIDTIPWNQENIK